MRIWDCHPQDLCNKHLLGQHLELHCIASVITGKAKGYSHHPEVVRFRDHDDGLWWLAVVHELMVWELERRWPGRHRLKKHPSPFPQDWHDIYDTCSNLDTEVMRSRPDLYVQRLEVLGWPFTSLEHGTPWDRDGVSMEWYLEHRENWSHQLVQDLYKQAEELVSEPVSAQEADVKMGGDGKPHVVPVAG